MALGDLDDRRRERARARAAQREGAGEELPIVFGGATIAVLPGEFALDVLAPLAEVNVDLAMLVRQALQMLGGEDDDGDTLALIVDVLAANPHLPAEVITAVQEMGRRLLGESGYAAFLAQRPSPWDVGALVGDVMSWYGVSLGELSPSPTSSSSGVTSNTTSSPTSVSTPAVSGDAPAKPDTSAYVG